MKSLAINSLKWRLALQVLGLLLPVMALLVYQTWSVLWRAERVEHARQLGAKAEQTYAQWRLFVLGASDAVDTGRLGPPALQAFQHARGLLRELAVDDPSLDIDALSVALGKVETPIAADASLDNILPLRERINSIDAQLGRVAQSYRGAEGTAIQASIAAARSQHDAVLSALLLTVVAVAYLLFRIVRSLTQPLARGTATALHKSSAIHAAISL